MPYLGKAKLLGGSEVIFNYGDGSRNTINNGYNNSLYVYDGNTSTKVEMYDNNLYGNCKLHENNGSIPSSLKFKPTGRKEKIGPKESGDFSLDLPEGITGKTVRLFLHYAYYISEGYITIRDLKLKINNTELSLKEAVDKNFIYNLVLMWSGESSAFNFGFKNILDLYDNAKDVSSHWPKANIIFMLTPNSTLSNVSYNTTGYAAVWEDGSIQDGLTVEWCDINKCRLLVKPATFFYGKGGEYLSKLYQDDKADENTKFNFYFPNITTEKNINLSEYFKNSSKSMDKTITLIGTTVDTGAEIIGYNYTDDQQPIYCYGTDKETVGIAINTKQYITENDKREDGKIYLADLIGKAYKLIYNAETGEIEQEEIDSTQYTITNTVSSYNWTDTTNIYDSRIFSISVKLNDTEFKASNTSTVVKPYKFTFNSDDSSIEVSKVIVGAIKYDSLNDIEFSHLIKGEQITIELNNYVYLKDPNTHDPYITISPSEYITDLVLSDEKTKTFSFKLTNDNNVRFTQNIKINKVSKRYSVTLVNGGGVNLPSENVKYFTANNYTSHIVFEGVSLKADYKDLIAAIADDAATYSYNNTDKTLTILPNQIKDIVITVSATALTKYDILFTNTKYINGSLEEKKFTESDIFTDFTWTGINIASGYRDLTASCTSGRASVTLQNGTLTVTPNGIGHITISFSAQSNTVNVTLKSNTTALNIKSPTSPITVNYETDKDKSVHGWSKSLDYNFEFDRTAYESVYIASKSSHITAQIATKFEITLSEFTSGEISLGLNKIPEYTLSVSYVNGGAAFQNGSKTYKSGATFTVKEWADKWSSTTNTDNTIKYKYSGFDVNGSATKISEGNYKITGNATLILYYNDAYEWKRTIGVYLAAYLDDTPHLSNSWSAWTTGDAHARELADAYAHGYGDGYYNFVKKDGYNYYYTMYNSNRPVYYTVSYNAYGGNWPVTQTQYSVLKGDTHDIPNTEPTKDGYTFLHWKDEYSNTYSAGGSISNVTKAYTLTAVYKENEPEYADVYIDYSFYLDNKLFDHYQSPEGRPDFTIEKNKWTSIYEYANSTETSYDPSSGKNITFYRNDNTITIVGTFEYNVYNSALFKVTGGTMIIVYYKFYGTTPTPKNYTLTAVYEDQRGTDLTGPNYYTRTEGDTFYKTDYQYYELDYDGSVYTLNSITVIGSYDNLGNNKYRITGDVTIHHYYDWDHYIEEPDDPGGGGTTDDDDDDDDPGGGGGGC